LQSGRSGENGDPNPRTPPQQPPPVEGTAGEGESMTPLQAEFQMRMRGALLNMPLDEGRGRSLNGGLVSMGMNGITNNNNGNSGNSDTASGGVGMNTNASSNRENISSIVYASLPETNNELNGGNGNGGVATTPSRGFQRMLSFQGTNQQESFRSSSSSLGGDSLSGSGNGAGEVASAPSTPNRPKLLRQYSSTSTSCSSPLPRSKHSTPSSKKQQIIDPFAHDQLHVLYRVATSTSSNNLMAETRLRSVSKTIGRRIPKAPSRILDAPELVDDYYLNLVSWGSNNVLAVALGQCVYLWEAETGNIKHLLTLRNEDDFVTSVSWANGVGGNNNQYIAVGTNHNAVQL
jgi:hypothetical protein